MSEHFEYSDTQIMFHYTKDLQPNPADFEMHTHDRCEIYLFLSGKGVFWVEGNQYPLSPGDILILRPHEAHCIAIDPGHTYERSALHFNPALIDQEANTDNLLLTTFLDREAGKNNLYHYSDFDSDFARRCFSFMMGGNKYTKQCILSYLYPLLFEIYRASEQKKLLRDVQPEPLSYQILQYINQNLTAPLSLESICKQFYISKSQLCRIFKKSVGSTVWHYITVKRLTLAKQMLSEGVPPNAVATQCGFSDYSVFWRAYRSEFGVTPKKDSLE